MSHEKSIRESGIENSFTHFPLQNPNEHITAPEDALQTNLVPELPPPGGYENLVKAMDVFSRCLFAYQMSNQDTKTIAKVILTS